MRKHHQSHLPNQTANSTHLMRAAVPFSYPIRLSSTLLIGIHETVDAEVTAENSEAIKGYIIPKISQATAAIIDDLVEMARKVDYAERLQNADRDGIMEVRGKIAKWKNAKKPK